MEWRVKSGLALTLLLMSSGCAGATERAARKDLTTARSRASRPVESSARPSDASRLPARAEGADLNHYLAVAMEQSPDLAAAFERWEASVDRISQARRLPDPMITFGYFLQSVETRVGPQRARVGLQQSFPWPTRLTANADSMSANARAQQKRVDALALNIRQRVEAAYWKLWLVRKLKETHSEHLLVVRSLSESVLARVAIGGATLAEQQQVDLTAARLEDRIEGMGEDEHTFIAELHAAMGVQEPQHPTTLTPPSPPAPPADSYAQLAAAVRAHPFIESFEYVAQSKEELARAKNAERYPNFTIGADWIITGEARMPNVPDSGKDAVIVGAGVSVPIWQGNYADGAQAARSEAKAERSEQRAAENNAIFELEASLAAVRDASRRVGLHEHTLVPQAESAYSSVLGVYATGKGTVAQTLLAQRDLLELRAELEKARADHALAWARLERVVGREVQSAATPETPSEKTNAGN